MQIFQKCCPPRTSVSVTMIPLSSALDKGLCCFAVSGRYGGDGDMRRTERRQWRAISCSVISCYQRVGDSCGYSRVGVSIDPEDTMSTAPVLVL